MRIKNQEDDEGDLKCALNIRNMTKNMFNAHLKSGRHRGILLMRIKQQEDGKGYFECAYKIRKMTRDMFNAHLKSGR